MVSWNWQHMNTVKKGLLLHMHRSLQYGHDGIKPSTYLEITHGMPNFSPNEWFRCTHVEPRSALAHFRRRLRSFLLSLTRCAYERHLIHLVWISGLGSLFAGNRIVRYWGGDCCRTARLGHALILDVLENNFKGLRRAALLPYTEDSLLVDDNHASSGRLARARLLHADGRGQCCTRVTLAVRSVLV